ncbi:MAG: hypothetical protein QM638_17605 [Nocardioides sp.]|uniref:hypothetical protein n=1 Tax=Nocardioides sp. TaxID=35761 RepID=UPI0039E40F20
MSAHGHPGGGTPVGGEVRVSADERDHLVMRALVAAVVAMVVLAGCGSSSGGSGGSAGATATTTATAAANDVSSTAAASTPAAAGDTLGVGGVSSVTTITNVLRSFTPSKRFESSPAAIAADGSAVVARFRVADPDHPLRLSQTRLYLTDVRDQDAANTLIPLGGARRKPTQLIGVSMNDNWVVWMETPSTSATVQPWTMYAYNRATRTTTRLTSSRKIKGVPALVAPGYTGPSLHGGMVIWAEVAKGGAAPRVDIVGCHLADCRRRTLIRGAAYPAVTSNAIYAVTAPGYRGIAGRKGHRDFHNVAIEAYKFGTDRVVRVRTPALPGSTTIIGLAAHGGTLAWTINGRRPQLVIDTGDNKPTTITGDKGGGFSYPVVTARTVVWAESSGDSPANVGGYLYRLQEHDVYSLGNKSGLYGVDAAGDYVSWQDAGLNNTTSINRVGRLR